VKRLMKFAFIISLLAILASPLKAEAASILGTGIDGELVVGPGQVVYIDQWYNNKYGAGQYLATTESMPNFSKVTVSPNGTLTVSAWNGSTGGRLFFKCTGDVIVQGTISVKGIGYRVADGLCADEAGENFGDDKIGTGGGGGAGSGSAGSSGFGARWQGYFFYGGPGESPAIPYPSMGHAGGNAADTQVYGGSSVSGGKGGRGGGHIKIYADTITVTGSITANGGKGTNGNYGESHCVATSGGGGGAGGAIELHGDILTLGNDKVVANGGDGGTGYYYNKDYYGGDGGAGGWGKIYLNIETDCFGSFTTPFLLQYIDLTPPTGTMQINGGACNTSTKSVILEFNATDNFGITTAIISNDNFVTSQTVPYADAINWDLIAGEGPKQVWVKLLDAAGNETTLDSCINFVSDLLAPTVQVEINGGVKSTTNANLQVVINASDNLSLITDMQMRYSFDGANWTAWEAFKFNKNITLNPSAPPSSPEIRRLFVQVQDKAGNVGNGYASIVFEKAVSLRAVASEQARINDFTPPEISVSTSDGRTATRGGSSVPIAIKAKDNVTPIGQLQVSIDGGNTWQQYNGLICVAVSGSGVKLIEILVRDLEGNIARDYLQIFVL
jgi:hypothetical protein